MSENAVRVFGVNKQREICGKQVEEQLLIETWWHNDETFHIRWAAMISLMDGDVAIRCVAEF